MKLVLQLYTPADTCATLNRMKEGRKLLLMCCLILPCHGTQDQQTPFSINSLLTCHVPDPAGGFLASMPEPRFRVPLQPGQPGTVWQPVKSQYDK